MCPAPPTIRPRCSRRSPRTPSTPTPSPATWCSTPCAGSGQTRIGSLLDTCSSTSDSQLSGTRRRLRGLVKLIPMARRAIVYTDFTDELGELTEEELSGLQPGTNLTRFEAKVRTYLRSHENQLAVQKLLRNRQITDVDMYELQRIFVESKIGTEKDIERAASEHGGLGLFLRSVTGLDYEAANAAFDAFQVGKTYSADQLHFLGLLTRYLAKNGTVDPEELFGPPFTGLAPTGPYALFPEDDVQAIADVLNTVKGTAVPVAATG